MRIHLRLQEHRNNEELRARYPHIRTEHTAYVVRLYSKTIEDRTRDILIYASGNNPENDRPPMFLEEVDDILETLSESEAIVHTALQKSEAVTASNVLGSRARDYYLSVSARMLQSVGLWRDNSGDFGAAWSGFGYKHGRFRALMMRKVRGQWQSPARKIQYREAALDLYTNILHGARVVVGTTAEVTAAGIMDTIREKVVAITADQNDREVETAMLPVLGTPFTRNSGLHLVGDSSQADPVTTKQRDLSLMPRLIAAGHPVTVLDE